MAQDRLAVVNGLLRDVSNLRASVSEVFRALADTTRLHPDVAADGGAASPRTSRSTSHLSRHVASMRHTITDAVDRVDKGVNSLRSIGDNPISQDSDTHANLRDLHQLFALRCGRSVLVPQLSVEEGVKQCCDRWRAQGLRVAFSMDASRVLAVNVVLNDSLSAQTQWSRRRDGTWSFDMADVKDSHSDDTTLTSPQYALSSIVAQCKRVGEMVCSRSCRDADLPAALDQMLRWFGGYRDLGVAVCHICKKLMQFDSDEAGQLPPTTMFHTDGSDQNMCHPSCVIRTVNSARQSGDKT